MAITFLCHICPLYQPSNRAPKKPHCSLNRARGLRIYYCKNYPNKNKLRYNKPTK